MKYRGKSHAKIFETEVAKHKDASNIFIGCLYLLTADTRVWSGMKHRVQNNSFIFSDVHLGDVSPDAYALFMTAKDIYNDEKHLFASDMTDKTLLSDKLFEIITCGIGICRNGLERNGEIC